MVIVAYWAMPAENKVIVIPPRVRFHFFEWLPDDGLYARNACLDVSESGHQCQGDGGGSVARARVESLSHRECRYAGGATHRRRALGAASRNGETQ
jgi:hypothetical protein